MTRRLTAHLFCSVAAGRVANLWQFNAFGPEEGDDGTCHQRRHGRGHRPELWQEWSQYWPSADASDPFGQFINRVRKHVVSRTLSGALGWNSEVIDSDPAAWSRELKQEGSGDILVVGGIETTRSLFLAGVVDALTLTVHPVATPEGRRLFDESVPVTRLRLIDSAITNAGNAVLTYASGT